MSNPVPSPCMNICKLNEDATICIGCKRTLPEIRAWAKMENNEKKAVWDRLAALHQAS